MALKMHLLRVDLAGIGFVLGVPAETGLAWLRRAAHRAEALNRPLLRDLPVPQVPLDEMGHLVERKQAWEIDEAGDSLPDGEAGRQWSWSTCAPAFRLLIAAVVEPHPLDTAKAVVAATKARVAGLPAFFSNGFTGSRTARIAACHVVTTVASTGKRGRPRQPVCEPHPELVSGPLVTQQTQGTLLTLRTRIGLGAQRWTQLGRTISTAVVERVNRTMRQALAPLACKTSSFCKDRERWRQRVVFFHAFYNMARPHRSWRQSLPLHERTCRGAICPRWRAGTPTMAAGLTDHVWTFHELLTARFEPLDSQSISQ